jgi:hypothetical protein
MKYIRAQTSRTHGIADFMFTDDSLNLGGDLVVLRSEVEWIEWVSSGKSKKKEKIMGRDWNSATEELQHQCLHDEYMFFTLYLCLFLRSAEFIKFDL